MYRVAYLRIDSSIALLESDVELAGVEGGGEGREVGKERASIWYSEIEVGFILAYREIIVFV